MLDGLSHEMLQFEHLMDETVLYVVQPVWSGCPSMSIRKLASLRRAAVAMRKLTILAILLVNMSMLGHIPLPASYHHGTRHGLPLCARLQFAKLVSMWFFRVLSFSMLSSQASVQSNLLSHNCA